MSCSINHQLFPSCEFICVISVCPSRAHNWNKIYLILFDLIILVWKVLKFLQVEGTTFAFVSKRLWVLFGHPNGPRINYVTNHCKRLGIISTICASDYR